MLKDARLGLRLTQGGQWTPVNTQDKTHREPAERRPSTLAPQAAQEPAAQVPAQTEAPLSATQAEQLEQLRQILSGQAELLGHRMGGENNF